MQKNILADTSCLILFDTIHKLSLLEELFGQIIITSIVKKEFGKKLPKNIIIEDPADQNYQKILELNLDPGEASIIALALQKDDALIIMDDAKARGELKMLKMTFTGSIGIIVLAKEMKLIESVSDILNEINNTNFRISENIMLEAKKLAGEI